MSLSKADVDAVIASSRANVSVLPVTTARYIVEIVMNEDSTKRTDEEHCEALAEEFLRALDDGYFSELCYDSSLRLEVVSREVLDVAPPNETEEMPDATT